MCKRLKPSNSPSGGCSRAHWWPEEGLATVPRGAELCFAQPSASSSCANTMGCSLSPSVFASPGSSRKDGCSRGLRLKGLPGKGFIFISQFLSVLKCNKTATPGCKLFLSSDLFLISSLVLCQISICTTCIWFISAMTHVSLQSWHAPARAYKIWQRTREDFQSHSSFLPPHMLSALHRDMQDHRGRLDHQGQRGKR